MSAPEPALDAFLIEQGLADAGEDTVWTPLAGGVSSDIWRVATRRGTICVKRALARLRVGAEWRAPTDRNAYEWAYLETVSAIAPSAVPRPIAHDPARGLFAMAWLAPDRHRLLKAELLAGRVDADVAAAVGALVGRIHAASAADPALPRRFASDANFHALRLDPYLLATARAHPAVADRLTAIADAVANTRRVLVHGDVSPKNILVGPDSPVLVDAECAWFGDPAFDLAFVLNHLVVKARVVAGCGDVLRASALRLADAYLRAVDWEPREDVAARAARLLPALALARVDGKSPLEYLDEPARAALRADALAALDRAPDTLAAAIAALAVRSAAARPPRDPA